MRLLACAMLALIAPAGASAQSADQLLSRVSAAYAPKETYELIGEVYAVKDDAGALEGRSPADVRAMRTQRVRTCIVDCMPGVGLLIDNTDPIQRRTAKGPSGYLYLQDGFYSVSPGSRQSLRTRVPDRAALGGMGALYVPTAIPSLLAWRASEGETGTTPESLPGRVCVNTPHAKFTIDTSDYTVTGWSEGDRSTMETTAVFIEWQTSPVCAARFPKLGFTRASRKGKPDFYTVVDFRAPIKRSDLDASYFKLATYADTIRDDRTGEVFGSDGVKLASFDRDLSRPNSPPDVLREDPATRAANQRDPMAPVLPLRKWGFPATLRVVGIAALVLAAAWAIRRRIQ
jgi:hypothetical protein